MPHEISTIPISGHYGEVTIIYTLNLKARSAIKHAPKWVRSGEIRFDEVED
ncbi:MAG: hypothetical protein ABGZ49_11300 [Akkermansiaceae bacterium]|tara:strand:- start:30 stop:182 length:153 start_codon:yes stop_codon:yes gene_type:complete